jgi:hypothetical protein
MACSSCMALASESAAPVGSGGFDPFELRAGCAVELEHTSNQDEACEIAKVHLREDRHYYTKLCKAFPGENGCQYLERRTSSPWKALAELGEGYPK